MWNKTIYQTYECDFDELDESFKRCCNLWKSTYPDWDYRFTNSEERREDVVSILCLSSVETEIYDSYSGVMQADIWRYAVTSVRGGMYADLDSIPISSVEPILHELSDEIELVSLPDGDQRNGKPGSNNCNFILKPNGEIASSLLFGVKQYLEADSKRLQYGLGLSAKNPLTELFADATVLHESKVAKILGPEYVSHSLDYKPNETYRRKYEKPRMPIQRRHVMEINKLHDDVYEMRNFLTLRELGAVHSLIRKTAEEAWFDDEGKKKYGTPDFWFGKNLHFTERTVLDSINEKMRNLLVSYSYYPSTIQLQRYKKGDFIKRHADQWIPDLPYYIGYGFCLYFNDDYEGGELEYPDLGIVVKPKAGSLYVHGGNVVHGSLPVLNDAVRYFSTVFVRGTKESPTKLDADFFD